MANTKHIEDRAERKRLKREQRQKLEKLYEGLSMKEKKAFRESETKGLKQWLQEQKED
ncbi:MAG: hypothetical protein ACQEXJ_13510 [Myxococcota bacterium]